MGGERKEFDEETFSWKLLPFKDNVEDLVSISLVFFSFTEPKSCLNELSLA